MSPSLSSDRVAAHIAVMAQYDSMFQTSYLPSMATCCSITTAVKSLILIGF